MKKILIINGHPDKESYCHALAEAYKKGALASGAEVKEIVLADLQFDPILHFGYRKRTELEPDLIEAWEKIKWAEHLVWVYPVWWGSVPALLKGFIDRVFLPGFGFKKRENSLLWDPLLKGRSARIISTLDQPVWFYWLVNRRPSHWAMKRLTLNFCGIKPVRTTTIGPIRLSTDAFRTRWLEKIERLGKAQI
ncbi:MAG TPA: NAD(P)H-dependent oxidoreductase [Pyrinomonadaceae bacterium]|nr:NAD(P)H-dependent oxidoreductase [Pyrinomonadaceae bacterium]